MLSVFFPPDPQTYWGWTLEDWRNVVLILGFIVGIPFAIGGFSLTLWRARIADKQTKIARHQTALSEQTADMDRFQKGSQMLGSERLSVRQAGIIMLDNLAKTHLQKSSIPDDGLPTMCAQTLERFVVDRGNEVLEDKNKAQNDTQAKEEAEDKAPQLPITADAQSALTALIDIRTKTEKPTDLPGAYLNGADLRRAKLRGADLSGANLMGAYLLKADLNGANLSGAKLSKSNLNWANLSGADLVKADLEGSYLIGADLSGAALIAANLSGADLMKANLSGADLPKADLPKANLFRANLSNTYFFNAEGIETCRFENCWAWSDSLPKGLPDTIAISRYPFDPSSHERDHRPAG